MVKIVSRSAYYLRQCCHLLFVLRLVQHTYNPTHQKTYVSTYCCCVCHDLVINTRWLIERLIHAWCYLAVGHKSCPIVEFMVYVLSNIIYLTRPYLRNTVVTVDVTCLLRHSHFRMVA